MIRLNLERDAAAIARAVTPYVMDALLGAIAGYKEQPMATKLITDNAADLQPFTLTFRSGVQEHYRADEKTLSTLLSDWRAALAGTTNPKEHVRRYDLHYLRNQAQIGVLLDIRSLESVQLPQRSER